MLIVCSSRAGGSAEAGAASALCPDETALRVPVAEGALALADALAFDHLLLAHGEPWIGGAREALRRFAAGEEP